MKSEGRMESQRPRRCEDQSEAAMKSQRPERCEKEVSDHDEKSEVAL